jgi:hypothetical protein
MRSRLIWAAPTVLKEPAYIIFYLIRRIYNDKSSFNSDL